MKKIYIGIICVVVFSLIVVLVLSYRFRFAGSYFSQAPNPSNFNIIFREDWGEGSEKGPYTETCHGVDTLENTISRCYGTPFGSQQVGKFILSQEDRIAIRQKVSELNLINTDPIITVGDGQECKLLHEKYMLQIQDGDNKWERSWDECAGAISVPYAQFSDFIVKLIESKDEFKKLGYED